MTDNEGCSTAFIFTGQTASCNGLSVARSQHAVTVSRPLAPNTAITKAKINSRHHGAEFKFKAIGEASGFQCKLQRQGHHRRKARLEAYGSPKRYKHLKPGRYVFAVRALGPGGTDRSPARREFMVKRRGQDASVVQM